MIGNPILVNVKKLIFMFCEFAIPDITKLQEAPTSDPFPFNRIKE